MIVGDSHQQIYGWRYAVNSLEKVDYPLFELTTSFRFDQEIAQLTRQAVSWRRHLELPSAINITGSGKRGRVRTHAVIARTNTGLLLYVAVTRTKGHLHVPENIFAELVEKRGGSTYNQG